MTQTETASSKLQQVKDAVSQFDGHFREHSIGSYLIIEHKTEFNVEFHPFIWIENTLHDDHSEFLTIEQALAAAIAYQYEGPNHRADTYFINSMR